MPQVLRAPRCAIEAHDAVVGGVAKFLSEILPLGPTDVCAKTIGVGVFVQLTAAAVPGA